MSLRSVAFYPTQLPVALLGRLMVRHVLLLVTLVAASIIAAPAALAQQPLAYWRLAETSGTTATDSKGGHNGAYQVGVTPGGGTTFVDGSATARFNGTSGFVLLPKSSDLASSYPSVSVSAWVHLDALSSDLQAIFSSTDQAFIHFQSFSSGNIAPYPNTTPGVFYGLPILQMSDLLGQWHQVAVVATSGDSRVYLDGNRYGTGNSTTFTSLTQSANALRIGSGFSNVRFWNGSLADVALYNTALSDGQVLYQFQHPGSLAAPEPSTPVTLYIGLMGLGMMIVKTHKRRVA